MNITKEALKELRKELDGAQSRVDSINSAINGLIELCEHDWVYRGHGHNYDYYECIICGKTRME